MCWKSHFCYWKNRTTISQHRTTMECEQTYGNRPVFTPKTQFSITQTPNWITKMFTGSICNTTTKTTQKHASNNIIHNIFAILSCFSNPNSRTTIESNFRIHIYITNWKLASPLPEFRWTIYRKWILPLPLLFASSRFSPFSRNSCFSFTWNVSDLPFLFSLLFS